MGLPRSDPHQSPAGGDAMSRPAQAWTEWTYSEYARLPDDGNRYEVIDGEVLVTPAPNLNHQRIAFRLIRILGDYVEANELGEMCWDVDLLFVTGQFVRPDMLFVPRRQQDQATDRGMEGVPGLIVEVLSPSSIAIDLVKKPQRYSDFGVPAYWVVDPREKAIVVFDLQAADVRSTAERDVLFWQPDANVQPLSLQVAEIFATVR
jgi:Uma2 family endonuclease